jgi:hypothetical protein
MSALLQPPHGLSPYSTLRRQRESVAGFQFSLGLRRGSFRSGTGADQEAAAIGFAGGRVGVAEVIQVGKHAAVGARTVSHCATEGERLIEIADRAAHVGQFGDGGVAERC